MPAWTAIGEWAELPMNLELLVWGLCGICALLLAATLGAFVIELLTLFRESASPLPAREFQGFGRAAPRVRPLPVSPAPLPRWQAVLRRAW